MPAWFGPALAAAAPGIMDAVGGIFSNSANRKEASRNRAFQERMSNTGYQRAAADLEAAGLNKYSMYQGTHSASTPGGSQAQQQNPMDAVNARLAMAQVKQIEAQTDKTREEKELLSIERGVKSTTQGDEPTYMQEMIARRRAYLRDQAYEGSLQPHMLQQAILDVMTTRLGLDEERAKSEFYKLFGRNAVMIDKLSGPAATAAGALGLSAAALARLMRGGVPSSARGIESLRGLFVAPKPLPKGGWRSFNSRRYPETSK